METSLPSDRLTVIKKAEDLCDLVYRETKPQLLKEDPSLADQMRRASVSIGSNISEGEWRWQTKDGIRFFQMAMGSAAELRFQAGVCERNALLPISVAKDISGRCDHIIAMLNKLIVARLQRLEKRKTEKDPNTES